MNKRQTRRLLWLAGIVAVVIATVASYSELATWLKSIFPGKTKWDYVEKIFIPVFPPALVAVAIWWLNNQAAARQEKAAIDQKESEVVTEFLKLMTPLILEKGLSQAYKGDQVVAVATSLILATLARLRSEAAPRRRSTIMRYLIDAGVANQAGIYDLPEANLSGADLIWADLRGANLRGADISGAILSGANLIEANLIRANLIRADLRWAKLIGADLIWADLRGANLRGADLSGAILSGADLSEADLSQGDLSEADLSGAVLSQIKWNDKTQWPVAERFNDAKNIPLELKEELGLP